MSFSILYLILIHCLSCALVSLNNLLLASSISWFICSYIFPFNVLISFGVFSQVVDIYFGGFPTRFNMSSFRSRIIDLLWSLPTRNVLRTLTSFSVFSFWGRLFIPGGCISHRFNNKRVVSSFISVSKSRSFYTQGWTGRYVCEFRIKPAPLELN